MPYMQPFVIHLAELEDHTLPLSIHIDDDLIARHGLGRSDGAVLVGFGPRGEKRVTIMAEDAVEEPEKVAGMVATFSFGEELFAWDAPVSRIEFPEVVVNHERAGA